MRKCEVRTCGRAELEQQRQMQRQPQNTAEAAVPHEQFPSEEQWQAMAAEQREEVLEPLIERAMRRAAEAAVRANVTVIMPGPEISQGGGEEERKAEEEKSIDPSAKGGPRDDTTDDTTKVCGYGMGEDRRCGAARAEGDEEFCARHARWVTLVEEEFGIPCPEDRRSLRECLQQVMALLLANKILRRDAEIVVKICRLLSGHLRAAPKKVKPTGRRGGREKFEWRN